MPSTDSSAEPNPARDARRRVRAEWERRRAARALDRYMEIYEQAVAGAGGTLPILTAGERFVEAVGDYVLSELHHNGDYGVPAADACDGHCSGNWTDPECSFHGRPKSTIKPNYGVSGDDLCEHGYRTGERSGVIVHLTDNTVCNRATRDMMYELRRETRGERRDPGGAS